MENKKRKKSKVKFDRDEPKIKSVFKSRKAKRHSTKENLKNMTKGAIDYDDYMEMEDWSDSR
ncbi:MAG: hypothetical protein CME98_16355 [Hyphomonas sp.]|jgi:hypothetical protein|nr:hypothetical protein [Hyphomonas sp.]|tara:strand:+ start:711 stop:896 length:186 start_codon:yes stop_codon:yes gene_type:complete